MKVLVIIVSYNFVPWLDRCLGSLRVLNTPADVLVVDNHSTDGTVERIKKGYPEVTLIENKENKGFGSANNQGLSYALEHGYEAVLLLNEDAWIDKDTLTELIDVCRKDVRRHFGILSPVHLTGDGKEVDHGFSVYTGMKTPGGKADRAVVEVPFVNAAIWLIPTDVIRKVGMFSPLFFLYGEDLDFVNRIKKHGFSLGYLPGVYGYHDRARRKVGKSDLLRADRVYFLSEYANINYGFGKAFAMSVLACMKKSLSRLFRGGWPDFRAYLMMMIYLLSQTGKVIGTRKQNKGGSC